MNNIANNKVHLLSEGILFIVSFCFLALYNYDFLYRVEENSLFLGNSIFAGEAINQSAGLMYYISRFTIQLFVRPIVGGLLLSVLLVAIERLLSMLSPVSGKLSFCNFIPSLLILLSQTILGYGVYEADEISYIVGITYGMLLSLGIVYLAKSLSIKGQIVVAICCAIGFFGFGFYAMLPFFLMAALKFKSKEKNWWMYGVAGLIMLLLLAYVASRYVFNEAYIRSLFAPMPDVFLIDAFICAFLAAVSAVILMAVKIEGAAEFEKKSLIINLSGLAILCLLTIGFSNRDVNLRALEKVQRQTENLDWNGVLNTVKDLERPTEPLGCYRFVALKNTNKLQTELFNYPCRFDTLKTRYSKLEVLTYYADYSFFMSELNMSYHWNMEAWVTTGRNAGLLKKFTIYALVRNEPMLARKYINLLKQTCSWRGWAEDHEKYIGHPDLLFADYPLFKEIAEKQHATEDYYNTGINMQMNLAQYKHLDPQQMELRLLTDLYFINSKQFAADIYAAQSLYREQMPQYFQEMIIILALSGGPNMVNLFPIDPKLIEQTREFVSLARTFSSPEDGAKSLKQYQGTYSYFVAFCEVFPKKLTNK